MNKIEFETKEIKEKNGQIKKLQKQKETKETKEQIEEFQKQKLKLFKRRYFYREETDENFELLTMCSGLNNLGNIKLLEIEFDLDCYSGNYEVEAKSQVFAAGDDADLSAYGKEISKQEFEEIADKKFKEVFQQKGF